MQLHFFTYNKNPYNNSNTLNHHNINDSNEEIDLELLTNNILNWKNNIDYFISKAIKIIGWVTRNLLTREKTTMLAIYKALIKTHLEYCVQICNPPAIQGNWGMIIKIENVQRKFTKLITEMKSLTYSERLKDFRLTTLVERRIRGNFIKVYI